MGSAELSWDHPKLAPCPPTGPGCPHPSLTPPLLHPTEPGPGTERGMDGPEIFLGPCEGALCGVPGQKRRCMSALEPVTVPSPKSEASWGEEEEEEEEDEEDEERSRGVPLRRACALRTSMRSRDPFRRHSWEPGKELRGVPGYDQLR